MSMRVMKVKHNEELNLKVNSIKISLLLLIQIIKVEKEEHLELQ